MGKGRNILYFGDSIMGQNPGKGYTDLLASHIYKRDATSRHHFLRIGGNSSFNLVQRMESESKVRSKSGGIRTILIGVGIVDSTGDILQEYSDNLTKIFDLAKNYTDNVVVSGLTMIETEGNFRSPSGRSYNNRTIECFDGVLLERAEDYNIPYVEMRKVLSKGDYTDEIHPNDEGHSKLFKKILGFESFFL